MTDDDNQDFDNQDFGGRKGAALVAGGTGGIGAATVRMLARRGSAVLFTYRSNEKSAEALTAELRAEEPRWSPCGRT